MTKILEIVDKREQNSIFKIKMEDILSCEVYGDSVVISLNTGQTFSLSDTYDILYIVDENGVRKNILQCKYLEKAIAKETVIIEDEVKKEIAKQISNLNDLFLTEISNKFTKEIIETKNEVANKENKILQLEVSLIEKNKIIQDLKNELQQRKNINAIKDENEAIKKENIKLQLENEKLNIENKQFKKELIELNESNANFHLSNEEKSSIIKKLELIKEKREKKIDFLKSTIETTFRILETLTETNDLCSNIKETLDKKFYKDEIAYGVNEVKLNIFRNQKINSIIEDLKNLTFIEEKCYNDFILNMKEKIENYNDDTKQVKDEFEKMPNIQSQKTKEINVQSWIKGIENFRKSIEGDVK